MFSTLEFKALQTLSADGKLLVFTRLVRMFAYGAGAVVLALYLTAAGFSERQIGFLLTGTLIGDGVLSLWIAGIADRFGRKRMLLIGALLMIVTGFIFALPSGHLLLTLATILGTMSPTGNEVGAFLSIEQATLPQTTTHEHRTPVFAWYNMLGSFATACGALTAGGFAALLQESGSAPLESYRLIFALYACLGIILFWLFARLSSRIEPIHREQIPAPGFLGNYFSLRRTRGIVLKLAALFMLDAFAGGLVVQSLVAYWFHIKFGLDAEILGSIFFGANLLAGLSALAAGRLAAKIGLINTMVWTHVPSNILLILVPLMPSAPLAIALLLLRFSISQMDVPTRQSYIMAVVEPDERSAAAAVTTVARTFSSALSPTLSGLMFAAGLLSVPFFLAGSLKIIYDLLLYRGFITIKPPEEQNVPPVR